MGKWETHVNISTRFGDSVNIKQKEQDIIEISALLSILSDATNHKIRLTDKNTNMHIVIGNQKEIVELINEISLILEEFDPKILERTVGYGIGFQLISQPIQFLLKDVIAKDKNISDFGGHLLAKHFVVFFSNFGQ